MSGGSATERARAVRAAAQRFANDVSGQRGGVHLRINDDDAASTRGFDRVFVGFGATIDAIPDVLRTTGVPEIRRAFAANFDGEAGRTRWAALAESTIAERWRLGYGARHPILQRTGALRRHVIGTPAVITSRPGSVELRIAPGSVVAGRPKYRALAKGSAAQHLPARPMVVITAQSATRVTSAISRALRNRAAANGLG